MVIHHEYAIKKLDRFFDVVRGRRKFFSFRIATSLQAVFLESKTAATRDWAQVRTPDRIHPAAN